MDHGPETSDLRANPRRSFIRHTAGVPIEVRAVDGGAPRTQQGINVSKGGLSFISDRAIPLGSTIQVRIAEVDPPFEAEARVVWCASEGDRHCIGVQFLSANDAFRARMVEQVCSIEQYRREIEEREGRVLTSPEAAAEWIGRYAGRFPDA
ncbi:PilZ domain-containing protein [Longimicrobium sp.]|uniref:PilZ domain-containing protein n=1 Tax=Longimicrobium sp. TaxID=2029185 RepID=UPI002BBF2805|nr:PilZ domain-containing protein [Longimicrobium sp.]HSU16548.1 PilZ domain-containing protein [Longimicrobium sp.]